MIHVKPHELVIGCTGAPASYWCMYNDTNNTVVSKRKKDGQIFETTCEKRLIKEIRLTFLNMGELENKI